MSTFDLPPAPNAPSTTPSRGSFWKRLPAPLRWAVLGGAGTFVACCGVLGLLVAIGSRMPRQAAQPTASTLQVQAVSVAVTDVPTATAQPTSAPTEQPTSVPTATRKPRPTFVPVLCKDGKTSTSPIATCATHGGTAARATEQAATAAARPTNAPTATSSPTTEPTPTSEPTATLVPTNVPKRAAPTAKPANSLSTNGRDVYNCGDFATWQQANAVYQANLPGDPNRLDNDDDGIPCESLRGAP